MRKITSRFAALLTVSFLLFNCSTTVIEEVEIIQNITYNGAVKSIISTNCTITCHSTATQLDAGLDLTTYASVKNAFQNGNGLPRINSAGGPMPPNGQMSATLIATIEKWGTDGYLEN